MFLKQFFVEGLGHASYLIGSDQTGEAAVVDPRRDTDEYLRAASEAGLRIRYVLETHVHNDFLSGAKAIADQLGADYVASAEGGLKMPYHAVREGDVLEMGEIHVRVLFTPGHTPEHVSYVVSDTSRADTPVLVFTGGDLLVGSVGRPDLLGIELGRTLAPKLYDSLFHKLLRLEDYVEVLPTHGAGSLCGRSISTKRTTTIGYERRFNPFLQKSEPGEFVEFVLSGNPHVPAYYRNMRPGNQQGADGFTAPAPRPLGLDEVRRAAGHDALVLDTRSAEAFLAGHIEGAYGVGLGPMLATWVGILLPHDVPLILVLERAEDWDGIVTALGRIGYDQVLGYLQGGMELWKERGLPLAHVDQADVHDLTQRLSSLHVLDVRMESEWATGHIKGAQRIPLHELPARLAEVDLTQPTAVVCGSGYRSSIATGILQRAGAQQLTNALGGMTAWVAAKLPLEQGESVGEKQRAEPDAAALTVAAAGH
ncbi:MAG: rhodanese-like domain-containing protein [Chloroflexota bacterium]